MNNNEMSNIQSQLKQEDSVDIKSWIVKFLSYWYLFLIFGFLAVVGGYLFNRYADRVYQVSSTIYIKEQKMGMDAAAMMTGMNFRNRGNVDNEIDVLRSRMLAEKTLKKLDFDVSYFAKGRIATVEQYGDNPFTVEIDYSEPQMVGVVYNVTLLDDGRFKLSAESKDAAIYDFANDMFVGRKENIDILKEQIKEAESSSQNDFPFNTKIIALGECGLDHHWNPSGEDHRNAEDFSTDMFKSEKELFEMQLLLAKDLSLPVIIHSRDAFKETLESVKKIGYHNGIIHCYSYGKTEAKEFLDYGWYISFSGSVTYTKKRCMNEMEELIKSIPDDRILVETDSPYLAPVPFRGKVNSPSLIKNTYDFIAKIKGISSEELSALVDKNISKLFNITKPDCKGN